MPPPRQCHRKANSFTASLYKAAQIQVRKEQAEERRAAESAKKIPVLDTHIAYLKEEIRKLTEQLENCRSSLENAENEKRELKSEVEKLRRLLEAMSNERSHQTFKNEKSVTFQKDRIEALETHIDAITPLTPTGGKYLKPYSMIKSKATVQERYNRIIKMIENLVGPLNVDAFLFEFMQIANDDPDRSFCLTLSPWDSFFTVVRHQLSDGFMKDFKAFTLERLKIDVFSSRQKIEEIKKQYSTSKFYSFELRKVLKPSRVGKEVLAETSLVKIADLKSLLSLRLETLARHNRLIFDSGTGDNIVIGVGADKGADTTKLAVVIENVSSPNNPHAILLAGIYTGNDSHELLQKNFSSIFDQIDALDSISYFNGTENVEKAVVKKLLGDCKCISSIYGHAGQNSRTPCYMCNRAWSTHGKNIGTLTNFDFESLGALRTLAEYRLTGTPLLAIEPSNCGPPGLHTLLGIIQYYIVDWLIGLAIKIDSGSSSDVNLKNRRKELRLLTSDVEEMEKLVETQTDSLDSLICIKETMESCLCKKKSSRRLPKQSCDSSCCVVSAAKKSSFSKTLLFQCSSCQGTSHDCCALLVNQEVQNMTSRCLLTCFDCQFGMISNSDRLRVVDDKLAVVRTDLSQNEDVLRVTDLERLKLERILKGAGPTRDLLEAAFRSVGCDNRIWYQELTGNQARKLLRASSVSKILSVFDASTNMQLTSSDLHEIQLMRNVMMDLSFLMTSASNSVKTDEEIDEIELVVKRFSKNLRLAQPNATATPKLHLLAAHLVPHLRLHRSWGRVSEQGIEGLHAVINKVNLRYASVMKTLHKSTLLVDRLGHHNLLFDVGSSWLKDD
ncbi:unnamed protein product [Caenorhabditis nigoni]|uniref:Zinc finger PHD-type domain-containing protein n=1 Tax=Caenorhabditis nigoni TaxID=1611254 RepID=A0A2G5VUY9_9PELO|nr:hypothetical protein B9Z55_000733 [Caenorhabditis nigoni]